MKTKLNVKLLRKIQKHILAEPKRFIMAGFFEHGKPGDFIWDYSLAGSGFPDCGTAACIAGWAVKLETGRFGQEATIGRRAEKLLGLDEATLQRDSLFSVYSWPSKFGRPFREAADPAIRAKIACARIDHFIATKGDE
jgi:hypothetical protein